MILRTIVLLLALGAAPQDAARQPAPPDADQKAAEKIIRDLFRQPYASKDPAAHRTVAKQLLDQSSDPKNDAATRFVLLREARDQAAIGGDVAVGLKAVDDAAAAFEVDAGALKLALLEKISRTLADPAEARSFGDACLAAAAERVQADDYDRAIKVLAVADGAARVSKDAGLAATVKARITEAAALKAEYAKLKPAEKMLQEHPTDTAASGQVGKFRCFLKRDWEKGLPLLAAGPEGQAKTLATSELAKPEGAADLAALGTGWNALAAEQPPAARPAIVEHAAQCWGRAWPSADEGLRKMLRERLKVALTKSTGKAASPLPPPWEWVGNFKPVLDETYAHSGTYSVRVPPAAGPSSGGVTSIRFPAKPGDEFTMSGWVMSDGNVEGDDQFRVDFYTSTNMFLSGDGPGIPKDQPYWTFVKHTVKCPAETANVRLICFRPLSKSGGVWLDDLSLRKTGDGRELIRNGSFEER
jgi:hypothetical protein